MNSTDRHCNNENKTCFETRTKLKLYDQDLVTKRSQLSV